ncbi:hypothetical protein LZC95_50710 [Pendulispora brunnea]|uniref:Uncharacterized protein n=1 Tax=Pendulispora brunnea TaxID=2905690 RepID=A0ABZ2K7P3_9BACT
MTSSHTARALILICSLAALACREEVSLGNPPWEAPPPSAPARWCERGQDAGTFSVVGAEYGSIRAMLAEPSSGVYVVAARDGAAGTVLQVQHGSPIVKGTVGLGPAHMALGKDSIYVTSSQSGQVFRVYYGEPPRVESISGRQNVGAIAAGPYGEVYWARATENGLIERYDFQSDRPAEVLSTWFPTALAFDGRSLYVSGQGPIIVYPAYSGQSTLPGRCDGRMLALTERDIFCADGGAINQIRREVPYSVNTRANFPDATVFDLVAAAGRLFFRVVPREAPSGSTRIMSMPLDVHAEPTIFATVQGDGQFLVADKCNLYMSVGGNSIMQWPL